MLWTSKQFSVEEGTYTTNFYLDLGSDANVSIDDFEIMNGHVTSIDTITDTPQEKNYRIYAMMTANPDLRLYPFDKSHASRHYRTQGVHREGYGLCY